MTDAPKICTDCGLPIGPDERAARGSDGDMHYRCFKRGTAHGREVKLKTCGNCHATIMPWTDACDQCGVGPRIGGSE